MSSPEQNAELLRRYVVALRDENLATVATRVERFVHADVEWRPGLITFGERTHLGIDAFRQYLMEAAPVSGGSMTIQEVRPVGDECALALTYIDYRSKDERFYSEYALAARIEGDRLRELRGFISHSRATRVVEEMATGATDRRPRA